MNVHGSMEHVVIKHNLRYIDMIFDSKKDNNTALTHLPELVVELMYRNQPNC